MLLLRLVQGIIIRPASPKGYLGHRPDGSPLLPGPKSLPRGAGTRTTEKSWAYPSCRIGQSCLVRYSCYPPPVVTSADSAWSPRLVTKTHGTWDPRGVHQASQSRADLIFWKSRSEV